MLGLFFHHDECPFYCLIDGLELLVLQWLAKMAPQLLNLSNLVSYMGCRKRLLLFELGCLLLQIERLTSQFADMA